MVRALNPGTQFSAVAIGPYEGELVSPTLESASAR